MKNRISIVIFLLLISLNSWAQIGGDYNPTNPTDPGNPTQEYTLTLKSTPTNGGSFNISSTNIAGGKTYTLRAYPNTDFAFVAWICNGDTLSKSTSYTYTMPFHDVEMTGAFIYSPSNPSDPNVITPKHKLTLKAMPTDGGSFNTSNASVSEGEKYNLRAYPNTDFAFQAWICDGDTLSKSASYDYIMPTHDVDITGIFTYRPSSPSDPQEQALKYQLSISATPINSGSFNISNERLVVGSNNSLRAYSNTDFVFKHWMIGDSILSSNTSWEYVMPPHNVQMVGVFEYNPSSPANPNRNHWNKETGEVIVDDFTPGNLNNAISSVISGNSSKDVQMIIVAGRMNSNDFGIANTYSNCTLLDLSRVTGITEIPSYAFDYTNLHMVYLPASTEKIGDRAFAECPNLTSITIYAMTPPTLGSNVFYGIPEGLVVYVPAAAIAQYQDVEAWDKFTLLPIQEDIRNISISLPEGTNVTDYSQMWLELTNTKSGQKMHYVMTDRSSYTFANIIRNTSWNAVLRNQRGDVFGKIDNIEVKDEDVSVVFASLAKPQNVSLTVKTPNGDNVTAKTQVTWIDSEGNYLAQSTGLSGLLSGYAVSYRVVLSQDLAMQYVAPEQKDYIFSDANNNLTLTLEPIKQVTISGCVKDLASKTALSGAIVNASQTFGGKYSKTVSTKTDNKGCYSLTVSNVPTSLAVSASDYISQTIVCDSLMKGNESINLSDISLKGISGAVVTLGLTFTKCPSEDDDEDTFQEWYADYNNVVYSIYNKTKQKAINQYNVQYPQIVLLEEVDENDVLEMTATSKVNAFIPVKATVTIDAEQRANAAFNIVELGKIKSVFAKNNNASVVGSLYDSNGKLVKSYDYSNASLTINDLVDGSYTLVTMGASKLFNSIYDLSQLPQTGLVLGTDYTQTTVDVQSGKVCAIDIAEVPTLDESKLYYTGDNTSFTVNKSSIVAGNYLTLTGHLDFKSAYAGNVSNVNLIVDLPESCEFVENSVMVGNNTSSYIIQNNRITIPMARYTDRVRFCIIPTLGGEYAPSALAQFDFDGETITQPIGSANYTAKDLSINVPSTVAKTTIPISGTAIGMSEIEIYDGDVLIGQTSSLSNGTWSTTCELHEPYNLSIHAISAKVTTKSGMVLASEKTEVTYNKDNIVAEKVTMLYFNPEMNKEYNIVFDLINGTVTPSSFYFFPYKSWPNWSNSGTEPKDFTFVVDLSNNDTTVVKDVTIGIYTKQNRWMDLKASYDENKGRWTAIHKFEESNLPTGVKVDFDADFEYLIDSKNLTDIQYKNDLMVNEYQKSLADTKYITDSIISLVGEECDYSIVESLFQQYGIELSSGRDNEIIESMDSLLFLSYVDSLSVINGNAPFIQNIENVFEQYGQNISYELDIEGVHARISMSKIDDCDISKLISDGFVNIPSTTGNIYERWEENSYERISIEENIHIRIEFLSSYNARAKAKTWDNIRSLCWEMRATISSIVAGLKVTQKQLGTFSSWFTLECDKNFARLMQEDQEIADALKVLEEKIANTPGFKQLTLNAKKSALLAKRAIISDELAKIVASQKTTLKFVGSAIGNLTSIISVLIDEMNTFDKVNSLSVPGCLYEKNPSKAYELEDDIEDLWQYTYQWYCWSAARCGIYVLGDVVLSESVVLPVVLTIIEGAAEIYYNRQKVKDFNSRYNSLKRKINNSTKYCEDDKCPKCHKKPCECEKPCPVCKHKPCVCCIYCKHYPCTCTFCPKCGKRKQFCTCRPCNKCGRIDCICKPEPTVDPIHDPSGFVYEGVFSNRLEGVTATCYYKEEVEDMYGDLHENIVKWDATEYAQENPLFTDDNGYYRWDVPQGMWQVKFEKEGYETTYSEWLPVPPPQLDVNIAMKQNVQPNVKNARAYEDAVEVEFDKYMMPELLNTDNIIVMAGNQQIEGTIELLNEEVKYEGETETFASKLRFNATAPFEGTEVTLMVNNRVKSYAGIRMQDNYSQSFTIEQEIRKIVSDSATVVRYGDSGVISVSVLPASASVGKVLNVRSSSSMILGTDVSSIKLDENGKADISVSGELPGTAALTFTIEGYDLSATTIVNVEQIDYTEITAPTANIASGTTVEKGTKITLTCATEGATIYYTLDGSCPCDEVSRLTYTEPIIVNKTVTIKAMAVASDMTESDIVEFTYIVDEGDGIDDVTIDENLTIYPLPVRDKLNITAGGKIIKSVSLVSMSGSTVVSASKPVTHVTIDVSSLTSGIYIINVVTEDKTYSRKIMKVE